MENELSEQTQDLRQALVPNFLKELENHNPEDTRQKFSSLIDRGCVVLDLTTEQAAAILDTTIPNVTRWRLGKVPSAANLVLAQLLKFVRQKAHPTHVPDDRYLAGCRELAEAYRYQEISADMVKELLWERFLTHQGLR